MSVIARPVHRLVVAIRTFGNCQHGETDCHVASLLAMTQNPDVFCVLTTFQPLKRISSFCFIRIPAGFPAGIYCAMGAVLVKKRGS